MKQVLFSIITSGGLAHQPPSFLQVPDPHCKTGRISFDGTVCCASWCGECDDYPSCSSVRGRDSKNSCCKSDVANMQCGNGDAPASTCLKTCNKANPPCIMDVPVHQPLNQAQRTATSDCGDHGHKAIEDWRAKAENAIVNDDVHYHASVHIVSLYGSQSYLDVCGTSGCGGGFEVSTTDEGHHRDGKSGTWKIELNHDGGDATHGNSVAILHHGDEVHIKNTKGTEDHAGSFLDSCGSACGSGHAVSTTDEHDDGRNRDGFSGTWIIERASGEGEVKYGDTIYIKNKKTEYYLDVCGAESQYSCTCSSGCGGGHEVQSHSYDGRSRGSSASWKIQKYQVD